MTIPLSPASDRRGPRETLLALTEAYLRRGQLDVGGRHSVTALEGRVRAPVAGVPAPEWAPLAVALAAMLRGEAETAVRLVAETLGTRAFPEALRPALLGIGIRAARAADRPALATRWHAGLLVRLQRAGQSAAEAQEGGPPAGPADAGAARRAAAARRFAQEAVLASLPEPIRELLGEDVYEAGYGAADEVEGFEALAATGSGPGADRPDPEAEDAETEAPAGGRPSAGRPSTGRRGGSGGGSGGAPSPSGAVLHLVTDAYHGDVVSMPARVDVLAATPGVPGEDGRLPGEAPQGTTLLTIRVAAGGPLPDPPDTAAWHLRFVGRARALDARTSDGSLLELTWEEGALIATLHPPDWFDELGVEPDVLATRVTHVVVVPESSTTEPA